MAIVDVRHEVVLALAHIHEAQREAKSLVDHGADDERVFAAGELDFLERQEGMLKSRLAEIDWRIAEHRTCLSWCAPGVVQPDVPAGQLDRPRLNLRLAPSRQSSRRRGRREARHGGRSECDADRRLEAQRRARDPGRLAGYQHTADPGHEPRGGDRLRPGRRPEDLGRHGAHPCRRQDRRAPPRAAGERDLRGAWAGADALGRGLEFVAEAGPGDFIYVPPFVPHQEINASADETLECVLVRSDNEAVVVNLDIEPVEKPEAVRWIDPIHRE